MIERLVDELVSDVSIQDLWGARTMQVRHLRGAVVDDGAVDDVNVHATVTGKQTDLLFRFVPLATGGGLDYLHVVALDGSRHTIMVFDGKNRHVVYHSSQDSSGQMKVEVDRREEFSGNPGLALQNSAH